jgi:hypothetical protein
MFTKKWVLFLAAMLVAASTASAQAATVTLPDTSQTTAVTASVPEQATVTVPATLTFTVNNITTTTAATAAVTVTNIALATVTKQLQISLQANAAAFTPPSVGATTWNAADISWAAGTWTNGTGTSGTLSNSAYNVVATCTAGTAGCSIAALGFTLAAKPTVQVSGNHTLTMTWKFASIGS